MSELSQASCEVRRIGAPKVSDAEANELLQQIPDWSLLKVDGINQLQRKYKFKTLLRLWHLPIDWEILPKRKGITLAC